jgi:hypothetical protein
MRQKDLAPTEVAQNQPITINRDRPLNRRFWPLRALKALEGFPWGCVTRSWLCSIATKCEDERSNSTPNATRSGDLKFRETYLLRGHLAQQAPATLWEYYTQLTEVEEVFKKFEGRFRDSPHFSSASPSHRGPHFHRFCDLLSSCHSAPALARLGARINSSCRPGKVQRDANDRCSSSHHRRSDHHPFALHPAGSRTSAPAQTTQTRITRSAAAQNHGIRPTGQIGISVPNTTTCPKPPTELRYYFSPLATARV